MDFIERLFLEAGRQTLVTLSHNWPFLLASILVAAGLKAFVDADRVSAFLSRWRGLGVVAATGAAVATPFCSCGTTAVILGMMASTMPLAPIVAFMVASPLSSPEELLYSAGLFGWPFAIAYFATSILLGLAGGGIAALLEKRGLLKGQARLAVAATPARASAMTFSASPACACSPVLATTGPKLAVSCCGSGPSQPEAVAIAAPRMATRDGAAAFFRSVLDVCRKLLPMFVGFAFLGYLVNGLVPEAWIKAAFGSGHAWGVPLAATVGLPLYVSSEASLPLVRAFLDSGMSQGAVMAFLIAGSGTSIGAITGALTIARWKVVGLVVATLWVGAILAGWGFDFLVAAGLA